MKANELRIGNLVSHKDLGVFEIDGITPHCGDYKIETQSRWVYIKNCDPIPLTEEWLLKFGFIGKYKSVHTHWNYKGFGIEQKSDEDDYGATIPTEQVFYYEYMYDIKYVHQLQNLYFSLKAEELTLKTT